MQVQPRVAGVRREPELTRALGRFQNDPQLAVDSLSSGLLPGATVALVGYSILAVGGEPRVFGLGPYRGGGLVEKCPGGTGEGVGPS